VKLTLAWTFDVSVTFVTVADASEAMLDPDCAWMRAWNSGPSCSSWTRLETGVLELKKAIQSAATACSAAASELAPEVPEPEDAPAEGAAGADGAGGADEELLLHATAPAATAHVSKIPEIDRRVCTEPFSSFLDQRGS
jgi:hypothetical protein